MTSKKTITQKEIAKLAGVSRTTVSMVLNGQTASLPESTCAHVRDVMLQNKYEVNYHAQQLRSGRSTFVNIVTAKGDLPQTATLLAHLEQELNKRGYNMLLSHLDPDTATAADARRFQSLHCIGTIVLEWFHRAEAPDSWAVAKSFNEFPNVVFLLRPALGKCSAVDIDHQAGVEEAVEHLLATGKKRIAMVQNDIYNFGMRRRLDGYRTALQRHGYLHSEEILWIAEDYNWGGLTNYAEQAEHVYETLIKTGRADAILAGNDTLAMRILKVLAKNSIRVPEDVAVIGFNNIITICESCTPELSSITVPPQELAEKLVTTLDNLINNVDGPLIISQPTAFICRDSC